MIWFVMGSMVLGVLLFVCAPLYRKQPIAIHVSSEVQDYLDQISMLENQISLSGEGIAELEATKTELQRQLIRRGGKITSTDQGPPSILLGSLFVGFGFAALGLYATLGEPELTQQGALQLPVLAPEQAIVQNATPQHENDMSLEQLVQRLESRLEQDPANAEGWMLYARSLMNLDRYDEAVRAYERVLVLSEYNPNVAEEFDSAKAFIAQRTNGSTQSTAPGPSSEDVQAAAEMSVDDRQAMVQGMVDGLSAKLSDNPDDPDGWTRLLRARKVLGQESQAKLEIDRMKGFFKDRPQTIDTVLKESGWALD